MMEQPSASVEGQQREPRFLWRGLLIVLPVVVLASIGILSLRQDQRLVDSDVRARARQFADEAVGRLWKKLLDQPSTSSAWRAGYPSSVAILHLSAQGELILPVPYSQVPVPNPVDSTRLDSGQATLWQSLNDYDATNSSPDGLLEALQAFLASKPPAEFAALAHFRLAARLRPLDAQKAAEEYRAVVSQFPDSVGETGLPLAPLAGLQLTEIALQSSTNQPPALQSTLEQCASNAVNRPSALTPLMLNQGGQWEEHYLNSTNLTSRWRDLWNLNVRNLNEPQRRVFRAAIRALDGSSPSGDSAAPTSMPIASLRSPSSWPDLFWFQEPPSSPQATNPPDARENAWLAMKQPPSADGSIRLVCREADEVRRLVQELAPAELSLPAYFGVDYQIAGHSFKGTNWTRFLAPQEHQPGVALGPAQEPTGGTLASAARSDGDGQSLIAVSVSLLDPATLYREQHQRRFWFGALVGVSALVAFVGLFSAWSAFRQQQRLYRMQSNFVSSVTHELRAPIGALRLMAENFQRGHVREPAEQNRFFDYIVQECSRLSSMVENILSLARIEQSRKEYEFEPTNVVLLVEDSIRLLQPKAAQANVALELQLDRQQLSLLPDEIILDGRAIQQALVNLIDNAIKHSPPNSVVTVGMAVKDEASIPPSATNRPQSASRWLSLWVADHGPGIPTEDHGRIFERFYRRESELRRETEGIGIGLSIVKHITEAHHGRVRVESEVGKGSRFILEVPLGSSANPKANG
jgi:signal transduction histidine kinase